MNENDLEAAEPEAYDAGRASVPGAVPRAAWRAASFRPLARFTVERSAAVREVFGQDGARVMELGQSSGFSGDRQDDFFRKG